MDEILELEDPSQSDGRPTAGAFFGMALAAVALAILAVA